MENEAFYPYERPMAKIHEEIERRMLEQDKQTFGGLYYTGYGRKLHIAVLNDTRDAYADLLSVKDVVLHTVKYSWEYLNGLQDAVNSLFGTYGIHASGMEPEHNQIYIGVDKLTENIYGEIQNELKKLGYAEQDAYSIREMSRAQFLGIPEIALAEAETSVRTTAATGGSVSMLTPELGDSSLPNGVLYGFAGLLLLGFAFIRLMAKAR